jgi:hypothetical protein
MKTKIEHCRFFFVFAEKKRNRTFAKNRRKTIDKNIKKTTKRARMCMYDFIRPKMETYLFPAITVTRNSSFFFSRCFVILQFRARARFFIFASLSYRQKKKKKHQKCSRNSKCFAGQVCAGSDLLMKFFESFDGARHKTRKTSDDFVERKERERERETKITTNQNPFPTNITQL